MHIKLKSWTCFLARHVPPLRSLPTPSNWFSFHTLHALPVPSFKSARFSFFPPSLPSLFLHDLPRPPLTFSSFSFFLFRPFPLTLLPVPALPLLALLSVPRTLPYFSFLPRPASLHLTFSLLTFSFPPFALPFLCSGSVSVACCRFLQRFCCA